jgi:septal ring factor EnvC (AmiA/AmiB activator)
MESIWPVVSAVIIAGGIAVTNAWIARHRISMSPQAEQAEYRDEIADLERQNAECRERSRQLNDYLAKCEDEHRATKEQLYRETIGRRIANRHLDAANARLRALGEEPYGDQSQGA